MNSLEELIRNGESSLQGQKLWEILYPGRVAFCGA